MTTTVETTPVETSPVESTPAALRRAAETWPEREAIADVQPGQDTRWTWSQLFDEVRRFAAGLVARGVEPGDRVVITPPVYPPFFELIPEAGGVVEEVPLLDDGTTWSLDLDGLERAFAGGARAFLLCHPHNPLGLVHPRADLEAVAAPASAPPAPAQD